MLSRPRHRLQDLATTQLRTGRHDGAGPLLTRTALGPLRPVTSALAAWPSHCLAAAGRVTRIRHCLRVREKKSTGVLKGWRALLDSQKNRLRSQLIEQLPECLEQGQERRQHWQAFHGGVPELKRGGLRVLLHSLLDSSNQQKAVQDTGRKLFQKQGLRRRQHWQVFLGAVPEKDKHRC